MNPPRLRCLFLLALLALSACRAESPPPPIPTVAPSQTPTPVPAAAADEARRAILAAEQARLAQDAFRVVSAVASSGADVLRTTAEYAAPNRFHLVTAEGEWLVVGERIYARQNGRWAAHTGGDAGKAAQEIANTVRPEDALQSLESALTNPAPLGTAVIDGQEARVYQYEQSLDVGGVPVRAVTRVWVRVSDGLPVKEELEGQSSTGRVSVLRLYEYGPGIVLDEPER